MHIPDGFLSILVSLIFWLLSAAAMAVALRRVNKDLDERRVPLMGVLAAAIFAGQMLNFAVAGGTSGHLMGAALAAILLGPWPATLVITVVVGVQALIFQDGGLLALGANLFNMAVIGVFVAHTAYEAVRRLARGRRWGLWLGGFLAAWFSVEAAALAVGLQLAASGISPANLAIPAMAAVHALIGVGEGLITVGALIFLSAARRDLLDGSRAAPGGRLPWAGGLLLALALAVAAPLASTRPDGLEYVAGQLGFLQEARQPLYRWIPDYLLPGVSNQALATIAAGALGVLMVFAAAMWVGISRRRSPGD
jgi:cobalt/nickel transport system permease protein